MLVLGLCAYGVLVGGSGGREAGPAVVDAGFEVIVAANREAGEGDVGCGDA